jgi:hypothetical protein
MFRAKIPLIAAAVTVLLTGAVYISLTGQLGDSIRKDMVTRLMGAAKLAQQSARLEALNFTNLPTQFAHEDEFSKALAQADMNEKRSLLFQAVQARNARFGAAGSRKADIIAVTDADGKVLVRDLDPNVLVGENFKARYKSVAIALGGNANKDIWNFEGKPMRVASAPIRGPDGRIIGVIIVGYVMTDREAREKKEDFGADAAYAVDGRLIATSFTVGGEGDTVKEDAERATELGKLVFESGSPLSVAISSEHPSDIFPLKVRGEDFLAIAAPMPGNSVNKSAGIVLLKSLTQALKPVGAAGALVLVLGGLALLVTLGSCVLEARRFLGPLDRLETGVAEVINGNLDYSFDKPSPDFEGIANALNVMLARLLGRPEPSEDEDGDQAMERRWKSDSMFEDVDAAQASGGTSAMADDVTLELANEPLDTYFRRTFDEYMAAKKQVGERIEGVTFDSFRAKLAQNETALKGKYKCKMVRFRVQVKGNQVTLKPVPIY